ncbi:hypothetical protein FB451DRAFT_478367 [Mycena latifolia]|nr:hypothetical protein FB451DRAFT_478367 [Mycena latifolia]
MECCFYLDLPEMDVDDTSGTYTPYLHPCLQDLALPPLTSALVYYPASFLYSPCPSSIRSTSLKSQMTKSSLTLYTAIRRNCVTSPLIPPPLAFGRTAPPATGSHQIGAAVYSLAIRTRLLPPFGRPRRAIPSLDPAHTHVFRRSLLTQAR